jgi:photosystem II stability/assembly factor-like uncharacterized protein
MKIFLLTTIMNFILCTQLLYAQWTDLKLPAASGGAVHSLAVKGTKLFAGKNEGIYVSDDNGLHWKKVNPYLPPRYSDYPQLRSIVATDDYIIVSCVDKDVHISTDDGENWVNQELETVPRRTPVNIAADGDWIICGYPLGYVFNGQSTDGGQSWIPFDSDPAPVLSATIKDSIALVASLSGLFRSVNYGSSWEKVYDLFNKLEDPISIAFSDNEAYVGINQNGINSYILISSDKGATWHDSTNISSFYINEIASTPAEADSQFVFAATDSGVFRSADEGQNWIKKNNGLNTKLILSLAFKVQGEEKPILFAGTGDGIFKSVDYGNNWIEIGSPSDWLFTSSGSEIYALSSQTSYTGNTKYRISESDSGYQTTVCRSVNNGSNWDILYSGYLENKSQINSFVINSNNVLFAAGGWYDFYSYIFQRMGSIVLTSDNSGSSWETVYIDTSTYSVVLGAHESEVYMNTYGQYPSAGLSRFFNNGDSWQNLNPVFSPIASGDSIVNPRLSTFAADGNKIYVGGTWRNYMGGRPPTSGLINLIGFSDNNGQSWSRIESPLDSITMVNNVQEDTLSLITEIYPDGNHIMVGMFAYNFSDYPWYPSYGGGLYHLYYNGSDWIIADTAFTNISVSGFAASGSTVFAGTENGVFSTYNYGADWKEINSGMGSKLVNDLFITNSYLFASTTNGIWKRPLSEITSTGGKNTDGPFPQKFSLSHNYPNPFNPTTIIHYQLKTKSHVQLTIYDLTGREVKKLVNQNQNAGEYSVNFNAGNFASGIYIYRLKTDLFEQSRKMILLR